ncbi:hemicentin-1 [Lingula anatina]|uniref:Hemicentin-1 n=1 Tax=Lingula anatina TaxID=7574 RepID=A0A1S3JJX0_LINAN|nr:hemicentin-1 [Lingula anatina]|eukprot:XP_013410204.1 hemicentin-1 [Lingula anatina]
MNWDAARRQCESEGAHLAVVDTLSKRDTLLSYITGRGMYSLFWVDGIEPKNDGNWIWYSNNTPINSSLWLPGEPNDLSREDLRTWGSWGSWGSCSVTCGSQGLRSRTRVCENPAPVGTGKPCPGADRQTEVCYPPPCPTCQVHNVPGATTSVSAARIYENEYVKYHCLPEHTLISGSLKRTCQADGTLTNEEPQCKKCCGKARYIVNGYPDTPASLCYGDHVNYLCDRGYKSSNSTPIVCSSPYEWKYLPLPKCEPDGECDSADIAAPQDGYKACSGDELDKVCYMHCSNGQQYTGGHDVFECSVKTGWEWKVRLRGSTSYVRSNIGTCQISDDPSGLLMFLTGPELRTSSSEPDEALIEEIKDEMMKKLLAANICTDPCKIQNIEVEQAVGHVNRRSVPQEKLFKMKISLYAAPAKGSTTTQQSTRIELSRIMKLLSTKAAALKQAITSQAITLEIDGARVTVKGDNIQISRPSLVCLDGSIRKGFDCFTCPAGTYHDLADKQCASCPFGQYQDQPGQMSCKLCPNGTTTDRLGISNSSQCREYEGCNCGIHPCILNGTAFECSCLPGYKSDNGTCIDIDECLSDICPANSRCINKEGSYRCECLPGYEGEYCTDINECKYPDSCPNSKMLCMNTVGSYSCTCPSGLFGDNCDSKCPQNSTDTGNSCLYISDTMVSYSGALNLCGNFHAGAHLVDVKDKISFKRLTYNLQSKRYWMGLNDMAAEGQFVYSDGTTMTSYNEWGSRDSVPPSNDRGKNCVIMDGGAAFTWSVVDCDDLNFAICEFTQV